MTTQTTDATTLTPIRGFPGLCCLKCGEPNGIRINLANVTVFNCENCDAELSDDEVRETMAPWTRVLAWIDQAPATE